MSRKSERGAVAVEFAILAPVLVMILLGIMEFGRAYNVQATLTNAAREGVRSMAINNDPVAARTAVKSAAGPPVLALQNSDISIVVSDGTSICSPTKLVTVTVSYNLSTLTGIAGPFALTGKGAMLCGG